MVSLVEVQPSESIRLKVFSMISWKILSAESGTTASVIITESIVARAGASIPAPLAIPLICVPARLTVDIFGTESVVIIACAQSNNDSFDRSAATELMPFIIFFIGRNSPIMPVEHTKISDDDNCNSEATCSAL